MFIFFLRATFIAYLDGIVLKFMPILELLNDVHDLETLQIYIY